MHAVNEAMEHIIRPADFARQPTGGAVNRRQVDGVIVTAGKQFKAMGSGYSRVVFTQRTGG